MCLGSVYSVLYRVLWRTRMGFEPTTFAILEQCHTNYNKCVVSFFWLQTCQKGVIAQPTSSQTLCQLGNSQLAMYDNDPAAESGKKALVDARLSYRASIAQEGKAITGRDIPEQLKGEIDWIPVKTYVYVYINALERLPILISWEEITWACLNKAIKG